MCSKLLGVTLLTTVGLLSDNLQAKPLSCHQHFKQLSRVIETNYAGYADHGRAWITAEERKISERIEYEPTSDCYSLLSDWLTIFKDPHLTITQVKDPNMDNGRLSISASQPHIRWLSETVAYLAIPNFELSNRSTLLSLIQRHAEPLKKMEGLIVDIRGNQGQSFIVMMELFRLIETNNYQSRWHVLASKANRSYYKRLLQRFQYDNKPELESMYSNLVAKMEAYPNTWVEYRWPIAHPDNALPDLKSIYILTDNAVANAAEEFVIAAKTNDMVTVVGARTRGSLDYGEVVTHSLGDDDYHVFVPSQKRVWYQYGPIDNKGLSPDISADTNGDQIINDTYDLILSKKE
ncbi:S41 family peptidase [Vibrio renipiscarius]|uniref:S41 family peptidase n=1 Tax=Vibrio renipiscarius TaxID=1461322 RepID=UPI00354C88F2